MKIRRVGAELFGVERERERERDGLTDMTKLKIAFSKYRNALNVQPFNSVHRNIYCMSSYENKTHKYTVWVDRSVTLRPQCGYGYFI